MAVVVPAAGAGVRLGGGGPKALRPLAGETLLSHALRRVLAAPSVGAVVVAAPLGAEPGVADLLAERSRSAVGRQVTAAVVTGGQHRQRSVALALAAVPAEFDIVLVHDAARALAPPELIEAVAAAVRTAGYAAVIPALPVTDTITQVDATGAVQGNLDRSTLRAVQTPQGFRRGVLVEAHTAGAARAAEGGFTATDDAGLVTRLGVPVHTVPGSPQAIKITTPADLAYAELLLAGSAPTRRFS